MKTQFNGEISHEITSNFTKATALSHGHFAVPYAESVRGLLQLPGEDKATETKVRSIADALNNASTEQLCHYFVRSYLKDLAHNKLHGA